MEKVSCLTCGRVPDEIDEYILAAEEDYETPEQFVIEEEGTYNPEIKKFWCTECYIKLGMPLGKARVLN